MSSTENQVLAKKIEEKTYLDPEYLYYPLTSNSIKYNIDSKTKLFKEHLLYETSQKKYYSSVSGKALGTKTLSGKSYLVIENDFKEKYETKKTLRKKINNLTKKNILEILNELDATKYTSNINYFINNFDKIDSLILSLVVCEESDKIYSSSFNRHNNEILEIFDALSQIFEISSPAIIISDTDEKNIEYVTNLSGMYPNIRIVLTNDKYPSSHPLLITRKLGLENALVLTPVDLYYLYTLIKREKKVLEKEIFITGDSLKKDIFVTTKLHTLISDLLNECKIKLHNDDIICKNSAIKGEVLDVTDYVDTDIDSLVIIKKDESIEKECINCGLCNKFCPQKLNPQRYKLSKKPFPGKCIDCNMCSFVCPSKIGRKR